MELHAVDGASAYTGTRKTATIHLEDLCRRFAVNIDELNLHDARTDTKLLCTVYSHLFVMDRI